MPAYLPENKLVLPVIDSSAALRERRLARLSRAIDGFEGEGFPVKRAFYGVPLSELDPFVHMDEMGEVEYGVNEAKGTPWHPHRGFETVTYMIDGTFVHRDSNGGGGIISNGDTQWMTAGRGILHIETPEEKLVETGGLFHGLQIWVNLPAKDKWVPPRYQDIRNENNCFLRSPDGGAFARIIAGQVGEYKGPGITHTDILLVHLTIESGARIEFPIPSDYNCLLYVLSGNGKLGEDHETVKIEASNLAVLKDGNKITASNIDKERPMEAIVLAGRPIREPVVQYGPFVMNTKSEIEQAFEDYRRGYLGTIPD